MYEGLPEFCYTTLPSDKDVIIVVKRGELGYYPVNPLSDVYLRSKDENNELIGVTKAQERAMRAGSMFGFNTPASNPLRYDEYGDWVREAVGE